METLLLTAGGLAVGTAVGWYLRPLTAWCPACGWRLICDHCGYRPAAFRRGRYNRLGNKPLGEGIHQEPGDG